MASKNDALEMRFAHSEYGLSARRLWEHTNLGQINVFGQSISSRRELNDATRFIDVIWIAGVEIALTGFTLYELRSGEFPEGIREIDRNIPQTDTFGPFTATFLGEVSAHLDVCADRQATRNQHQQFLPSARPGDCFGISGLHSSLQHRLRSMGNARASPEQWQSTIENFRKKGLRAEELERSGLLPHLLEQEQSSAKLLANDLAVSCDFELLRMSVIPVVKDAQRQLHFTSAPTRRLIKTKRLPRAQDGQRRTVSQFDPVLGYRLEKVEHQTLWGEESHWQAVTHEGHLIADPTRKALHSTIELAAVAAASHAQQHFPKRVALVGIPVDRDRSFRFVVTGDSGSS